MLGEGGTPLSELQAAIDAFLQRGDRKVDLRAFRGAIDSLEGEFSVVARESQRSGEHLAGGNITAASWIARTCNMSVTSAADRLRVGEQLAVLPRGAAALASGEIGYQSVSVLAHLRDKLGEKRELFDEEEMLGYAREFSVSGLPRLCPFAWHVLPPEASS